MIDEDLNLLTSNIPITEVDPTLLQTADEMQIFYETDIHEESFKNLLKEFCHEYQIPFLENNISKSSKNAALIFYKIKEDGGEVEERYSSLVKYLQSIPKIDITENFNPFKMKEKWMKFFKATYSKILIDTDRALKNEFSDLLKSFLTD